ncbi:hypothetical protein llap_10854 [Limosa lapponica baueri]|uniref:Uncharacterized protein n=1 Tax=Limosa lapponica baueri TaxID=1758121 RepID=A0A2I0TYE0_LIMLA|nr:hypothetical protein llap_10854 [Limosa lapponica baueri]
MEGEELVQNQPVYQNSLAGASNETTSSEKQAPGLWDEEPAELNKKTVQKSAPTNNYYGTSLDILALARGYSTYDFAFAGLLKQGSGIKYV